MGKHDAHTLTLLLLNLCSNTNPMWPDSNIWRLTRTPASTPAWSVIVIRKHQETYAAFILQQSLYSAEAFSLEIMLTPCWPDITHHTSSVLLGEMNGDRKLKSTNVFTLICCDHHKCGPWTISTCTIWKKNKEICVFSDLVSAKYFLWWTYLPQAYIQERSHYVYYRVCGKYVKILNNLLY